MGPTRPTADELEQLLQRTIEEHGDVSLAEFCRLSDIPRSTIYEVCGSWASLRRRAGLPPRRRPRPQHTDEEIVTALRQLVDAEGPDVTQTRFLHVAGYSHELIHQRFGGFAALRDRAGLPPRTCDPRRRISDKELLEDLSRLWTRMGRFPTWSEIALLGRYCAATYARRLAPRTRLLHAQTARYVILKELDERYGPDHPDRESMLATALERMFGRRRSARRRSIRHPRRAPLSGRG